MKPNPDSPVAAVLSQIWDLAVLNILWLLCSLPAVTVGVSTAAMHRVVQGMLRKEEQSIPAVFFRAFRQNFRQATGLWLILLAAVAVLSGDLYFMAHWRFFGKIVLQSFFLMLLLLCIFVSQYLFPLLAEFQNNSRSMLKNALLMSVRHLPQTVGMFLLRLVPLLLFLFYTEIFLCGFLFWIFLGFALIAYVDELLLSRIFRTCAGRNP